MKLATLFLALLSASSANSHRAAGTITASLDPAALAAPVSLPQTLAWPGGLGIPTVITWSSTTGNSGIAWGTTASITGANAYLSYNATSLLINVPAGKSVAFQDNAVNFLTFGLTAGNGQIRVPNATNLVITDGTNTLGTFVDSGTVGSLTVTSSYSFAGTVGEINTVNVTSPKVRFKTSLVFQDDAQTGNTMATLTDNGTTGYFSIDQIRPSTAGGNIVFAESAGNTAFTIRDDGTAGSILISGQLGEVFSAASAQTTFTTSHIWKDDGGNTMLTITDNGTTGILEVSDRFQVGGANVILDDSGIDMVLVSGGEDWIFQGGGLVERFRFTASASVSTKLAVANATNFIITDGTNTLGTFVDSGTVGSLTVTSSYSFAGTVGEINTVNVTSPKVRFKTSLVFQDDAQTGNTMVTFTDNGTTATVLAQTYNVNNGGAFGNTSDTDETITSTAASGWAYNTSTGNVHLFQVQGAEVARLTGSSLTLAAGINETVPGTFTQGGGTAIVKIGRYSATIDFANIVSACTAESTITATGVAGADICDCADNGTSGSANVWFVCRTTTNTLNVKACTFTATDLASQVISCTTIEY